MTLKADDTAATRLLTAAVRRARATIAGGDTTVALTHAGEVVYRWRPYERAAVVAMLAEATRSAALLIDGES